MKSNTALNTQRGLRYKTDTATVAQIAVNLQGRGFVPSHTCLVINESFKGCCLVVQNISDLEVGQIVWAKVGELAPAEAEVRWVHKLDDEVFKLGLLYLD